MPVHSHTRDYRRTLEEANSLNGRTDNYSWLRNLLDT